MAALMPVRGIEPLTGSVSPTSNTGGVVVCTCDPVYARTRFIGRSDGMISGFDQLVLAG